jgi:phospholipase/carboxylesterase
MNTDSQSLSLVHRYQPASQSSPNGTPMLILLHGVGSNEDDLFGLAPYLDPRFSIVSARAPLPHSFGGYAWFDVQFTPDGILFDEAQAEQSSRLLLKFIDDVRAAYVPAQVFLVGFSQGAIMSAGVLLRSPAAISGAVLMSGRVPEVSEVADGDALRGKPVLMTHGTYDEVLPVEFGREGNARLAGLGLDVAYREFPMGHQVSEESLEAVDEWLAIRAGHN